MTFMDPWHCCLRVPLPPLYIHIYIKDIYKIIFYNCIGIGIKINSMIICHYYYIMFSFDFKSR